MFSSHSRMRGRGSPPDAEGPPMFVGPAVPLGSTEVLVRGAMASPLIHPLGTAYNDEILSAARDAKDMLPQIFISACEALHRDGWDLELTGAELTARASLDEEEIRSLAAAGFFPRGFPLHLGAGVPGGDPHVALLVGGVLAGYEPHPALFPCQLLPAIVCNELTGAQHLVEDETDLRETFLDEVRTTICTWREHDAEFAALPWVNSRRAVDRVARDVLGARGGVPAWAAIGHLSPDDEPRPLVSVYVVGGLAWFGALSTLNGPTQSVPRITSEGLAAIEFQRGKDLDLTTPLGGDR